MPTLDARRADWEAEYRFRRAPNPAARYRFDASDLAKPDVLEHVLRTLDGKWRSASPAAVGSLFVKAYARILVAALDAMSRDGVGVHASAGACTLELDDQLQPSIVWNGDDADIVPCPADERVEWRNRIGKSLFGDHLEPLFRAVSAHAHVSMCTLWENALVYIHHFYNAWSDGETDESKKAVLQDDYAFVTKYAGCDLFGACLDNPLRIEGSCVSHPLKPGETIRVRKTCCLRYFLKDGRNCTVCPRLTEEERLAAFANKK
ncbi:IucA/IucC family C-terminal-domain containing protein [Paenibacillus flagellatus]|uniref:Aerobactin siderophore biosynthesis IucA/IucC-like C-terminal domain-containing protein n=1 Tax=Paenibacillus flagellatus TaxID=2211139 RepID=A0A2V5KAH1_9BACL|nr:IucA/IucC family C-terminal-domain containing protein [Paenibacillus flagellatus]PYI55084.1 hypothetical protein DLM86_11160 [Paenibacillus flagellatus]